VKIERILVPTDFSASAEKAYAAAIRFASAFGARIELLHVYDLPDLASHYEITFPDEVSDGIREAANQKLEDWRKRAQAADVEATTHLEFGRPSRVVAQRAAESKADLIVIGTRGLNAFTQVLLGSVAERTVRVAPCPVLTVGNDAALDGWGAVRESAG
jgi:nucleotide-binding universal stress UspA family protein